jgi:hypothetical protein
MRLRALFCWTDNLVAGPTTAVVLYELGQPFLYIDGACHYWVSSWNSDDALQTASASSSLEMTQFLSRMFLLARGR